MICFRLRTKWQNCRGYVSSYERTPKNGVLLSIVFFNEAEAVAAITEYDEDEPIKPGCTTS